ncbi:MAG: DUF6798 domain-containing protein [Thermogutta sp.]
MWHSFQNRFLAKSTVVAAAEFVAIAAMIVLQGAWPVPEVNEPYYLGKAAHFWNPSWCPRDDFLITQDAHQVFYFTFGWLACFLDLPTMAWVGRIFTWLLLAEVLRRLGRAIGLKGLVLVFAVVLFAAFQDRCDMAGEWVIGGVEAKGFSYVLVFLALAQLAQGRWSATLIMLGIATALHVLVGGWSLVATALAWLFEGPRRPRLRELLPAAGVSLILALPGLIPSLALSWGVPASILREANRIYTFERLSHHLVPGAFRPQDVFNFSMLTASFLGLGFLRNDNACWNRFRHFVLGSLIIAGCGWMIGLTVNTFPNFAAALLRYYWFRLSDVTVPLAAAFLMAFLMSHQISIPHPWRDTCLAIVFVFLAYHVGNLVVLRSQHRIPRTEWSVTMVSAWEEDALIRDEYKDWQEVCQWIAEHTPPDARFLTPSMKSTFKWYAQRSEVATWKEIPQDARSIVAWWEKLKDIYTVYDPEWGSWWVRNAARLGEDRLLTQAAKYRFEYIVTVSEPRLDLEIVFSRPDNMFAVYRARRPAKAGQPSNRSSP